VFRRIEHALLLPNLKEPANACALGFQRKRFRIKRVDGFCRLIRSHLRTCHILSRLTPRGYGDCPVKRSRIYQITVYLDGTSSCRTCALGLGLGGREGLLGNVTWIGTVMSDSRK
jgi:hypothetical protein